MGEEAYGESSLPFSDKLSRISLMLKSRIFFIQRQTDIHFSKIFFYSQSRATQVLKDKLLALFTWRSRTFTPVIGEQLDKVSVTYDTNRAINRGNGFKKGFSDAYNLDYIPDEFHLLINKYFKEIEKYLGKNFLFENPLVFRNLNFDDRFVSYDVYSNVWHQDSHDGNRLVKIFILMEDVDLTTGPFKFLPWQTVKSNWPKLANRWDMEKMKSLPAFDDEITFTGDKGSYAILDTSRHMHRGSIPKTSRDMMQITLYPKWRKTKDRKPYVSR
jgi:hypothetical protein